MTFKPLHTGVLIYPDKEDNKTSGGIILTSTDSKFANGTVVATGIGHKSGDTVIELQVKNGDRVMFLRSAAKEVSTEVGKWLLIEEKDILGILE